MASNLTGNLLGGPLLADLLARLSAAEVALASASIPQLYYKLLHVSGHYNSLLGVLGALALDRSPAAANITWLRCGGWGRLGVAPPPRRSVSPTASRPRPPEQRARPALPLQQATITGRSHGL